MSQPIILHIDAPGERARLVQHLAEAMAEAGAYPLGLPALLMIGESVVESLESYAKLTAIARAVVFDGPGLFKDDGTLNTVETEPADGPAR